MNKTPLIIYLVILAVAVVLAGSLAFNTSSRFSPRSELVGKKLVEKFTAGDVAEVRIANAEDEVTLVRKDGSWVVPSRGDYPIDSEKELQRLVASILSLQVGLEIPAEDTHYALMQLLSPDEKELAAKYEEAEKAKGNDDPAEPTGLLIHLKGADGSDLAKLVLGEEFGGDPSQPRRGLVARSLAGHKGAWKLLGTVNRRTGELGGADVRRGVIAEPKAWLKHDFLEVEKIKSISLSAPNDAEFKGWTVTRDSEEGDFTTEGLAEDEELDSTATGSFKTLFSSLHFEDVLDPAEAEGKKDTANARQAVIKTFDGFTYTFEITPMKEEESDPDDDGPPPAPTNYIGTVKVEADLAETREKEDGETEEQAKARDEAHAVLLENLQDKLAEEKTYESRIYEFARFTMSSLLKGRDEIVKKKDPPSPDGEEASSTTSPFPGGRPSAVTPPVRVPPLTPPSPDDE